MVKERLKRWMAPCDYPQMGKALEKRLPNIQRKGRFHVLGIEEGSRKLGTGQPV